MDSHGDRPREACGVIGLLRTAAAAALPARHGLLALQHRGEEAAGLCVIDQGRPRSILGAGLVVDVLTEAAVGALPGGLALGHVRYSTAGARCGVKAQPIERRVCGQWFAVAHNGNLIGCDELTREAGLPIDPDRTDSELIAELLCHELLGQELTARPDRGDPPLLTALTAVLPRLTGSFSLVLSDGHRLYGVRDRKGMRPLCLGAFDDGWALASETQALTAMGGRFVRELAAGEVVIIDPAGVRSEQPFPADQVEHRLCLFEFVYFSSPAGRLYGRRIDESRRRAGAALADFAPLPVDANARSRPALVVPVPSSAEYAAQGYAARGGLEFGRALIRSAAVGRSFLAAAQSTREQKVRDKLTAVPELVAGRRIVLVDDSLVRGTTARAVVQMLRDAGAVEVHLRIASPPWRWPCHFGIDVGDVDQLAAGISPMSQVQAELGCDSLAYLPLDRVIDAAGVQADQFCTGCMTGRYPVPVPDTAGRRPVDLFLSEPARGDRRTIPAQSRGVCA